MRFKIVSILVFIFLTSQNLIAQTDNEVVNAYIERYLENTTDQIDIQQFSSDLLYYFENPINLNKATADQLFSAPFLSSFQALDILQHRKSFGNFISIYELQVLESFGTIELQQLLPFVSISSSFIPFNKKDLWQNGSHQLLTLTERNTPKNKGNLIRDTISASSDASYYTGSPWYNNFRYRYDYKSYISFGLNAEKDAGETFFTGNNKAGYDFYSFYFQARNFGKIKVLNIGDFQANFGQGLTLSTGLAFGKSSLISSAKRNFTGFGAFRSLRENAYLRGAAISIQQNNLSFGAFGSYKRVDGNALSEIASENEEPEITTLIQEDGGFHRTPNELADKQIVTDFQFGAYAEYNLPFGKIGAIHTARKLGSTLLPSPRPDNTFTFSGNEYSKNGMYYDLVFRTINFYGEVSLASNKNSLANVHGALIGLSKNVDFSLVYRNYSKSFITLQTNGFGESSEAANEAGFYSGFLLRPTKSISILGYYDIFSSKWLRFAIDAPSAGNDIWSEINYTPNKKFSAYYRFRIEQKQVNTPGEVANQIATYALKRHRVHFNYNVSKALELRNRIEWNSYSLLGKTTYGSLIYQDIIYRPMFAKVELSGRIAYSKLDNFDNRLYAFEQVPIYDYPLYTHSYSGLRFYILTRVRATPHFDVWFRYALAQHDVPLTSLLPAPTIGSGLDEIQGNNKQTFTLQLRYLLK